MRKKIIIRNPEGIKHITYDVEVKSGDLIMVNFQALEQYQKLRENDCVLVVEEVFETEDGGWMVSALLGHYNGKTIVRLREHEFDLVGFKRSSL